MRGDVFLTGSTGYVGSSLLEKLLNATDAKLHLLVRSRREESPDSRIKQVLAGLSLHTDLSRLSERIDVAEGDVSVERLGLDESTYETVAENVSHIIHCAAAARFDLGLEEARRTNVRGTEHILNFAQTCTRLERIDYIGTAYVAGRRKGIIKEEELDEGQEHNNTYEQSKLEAEKLVREHVGTLPITILRPSIVICDSKTGRASSHNGFYRALSMYSSGRLTMLPGHPSSLLDLVPVDYVAEAAYSLWDNANSTGRCYHLTAGPDNVTTLEELRDLASRYFGREKFALIPPEAFRASISRMEGGLSQEERDMIDEIRLYMPYLSSELRFDNSNTVKDTGLEAPEVSTYFETMARYVMRETTA